MFVTKAIGIKRIKNHPGNIIVIGEQKDVYIVNVYKMIVYKHFQYEIDGYISSVFKDKNFVICGNFNSFNQIDIDKKGKVFIWRDDSEPSPIKNHNSSIMLEITN